MNRNAIVAAAVRTVLGALVLQAESRACGPQGHRDIGIQAHNGHLQTGVYHLDHPENALLLDTGTRLWSSAFQVNALDPFFTDKPGFGAVAGSGLPPGTQVGFNILSDLLYWDGTGPAHFGPVVNQERLRIKFGFQNRYAGTGTGFVAGFNFATVTSDGEIHQHVSFFLLGADGNAVPASQDGLQATSGIYLIQIEVTLAADTIKSDPIWLVFNNGLDDCLDCLALNDLGARMAMDRPPADLDFDRRVARSDVDSLAACFTGPDLPWTNPCCRIADLDSDGDVDQSDFGLLQRCFSGESLAAPECRP
ncbi:MAG TPA: hypothetical protein PKY77_04770 [Phycisphaerae bacterium]|nr:hypothetical protein [Phycisphaerae bacterium]HRY67173.1 hypothetical protein [Phycisphaerae bacterium]HSA26458.1 hypothetical protein [Phycisphaerae bacterium]